MPKIFQNRSFKIIMAGGLGLVVIAILYFNMFYQISPAQAQKVCQEFSKDVREQIVSIEGYNVINESTSCMETEDEMGGTDYILGVKFKVSKAGNNSVGAVENDIDYLAARLPRKNYPVWVDNIPAKDGYPQTICVSASRYLGQNGRDMEQVTPNIYPRYAEPGTTEGFIPCDGI